MDKFPKVMGMGDVTELLGVSRQYVDKLVAQGKLRCQETSTGKVFLEKDVVVLKKRRIEKRNVRKSETRTQ